MSAMDGVLVVVKARVIRSRCGGGVEGSQVTYLPWVWVRRSGGFKFQAGAVYDDVRARRECQRAGAGKRPRTCLCVKSKSPPTQSNDSVHIY